MLLLLKLTSRQTPKFITAYGPEAEFMDSTTDVEVALEAVAAEAEFKSVGTVVVEASAAETEFKEEANAEVTNNVTKVTVMEGNLTAVGARSGSVSSASSDQVGLQIASEMATLPWKVMELGSKILKIQLGRLKLLQKLSSMLAFLKRSNSTLMLLLLKLTARQKLMMSSSLLLLLHKPVSKLSSSLPMVLKLRLSYSATVDKRHGLCCW
jgi:hypothetical protein